MISIIIPTYNRYESLQRCIKSLLCQSMDRNCFEILIIDDGSTDNTRSIKKTAGNIRCFHRDNRGPGASCNFGIKKARGEIIAFIDDDCVADIDWLNNIAASFEQRNDICGLGGSLANPYISKISWANYILNFSSFFPLGTVRQTDFAANCNSAYRTEVLKCFSHAETKGLEMNYHETFLQYNLKKAGKKMIFNPDIKVTHFEDIRTIDDLLRKQRIQGAGFGKYYYIHGFVGKILHDVRFLNYLCPRLMFLFSRCSRSHVYLKQFIRCFPLIARGEFERARVINQR